jgi:hypothetical protein
MKILQLSKFKAVWQYLLKALAISSELQVWQTYHCNSCTCWHAYDPITKRSACFCCQEDMRAWIEQHHYTR